MKLCHEVTVRFRDCDAYQHVNNAVYLTYFEEARGAWFTRFQPGATSIQQFPFILASAQVDFKSPARYGERLSVSLAVGEIRSRSWEFVYEIRAGERLVAAGKTVQVAYDYGSGTAIAIPPDLRRALEAGREPGCPGES